MMLLPPLLLQLHQHPPQNPQHAGEAEAAVILGIDILSPFALPMIQHLLIMHHSSSTTPQPQATAA
jgi:hypothetical protein